MRIKFITFFARWCRCMTIDCHLSATKLQFDNSVDPDSNLKLSTDQARMLVANTIFLFEFALSVNSTARSIRTRRSGSPGISIRIIFPRSERGRQGHQGSGRLLGQLLVRSPNGFVVQIQFASSALAIITNMNNFNIPSVSLTTDRQRLASFS
jgi:hypothetical protein